MANRLDMNPDSLRRLAEAQEAAAARVRNSARQPTDWLNSFPANYGSIATPVFRAMKRYYNARERAGEVPRHCWNELRATHELLAASVLIGHVDVAHVGLGHLRIDDGADALRAIVFQRRCTELVPLLDAKTSWQQFRDIVPVDLHRITAESNQRAVSTTGAHPIPRSVIGQIDSRAGGS